VLGMATTCWYQCVDCWPVSMASSGSVAGLVLVGWSMHILGFTGVCGCGVDDMVELNCVWAFMCVSMCIVQRLLTVFCSSLGFSFRFGELPGLGVYVLFRMKHL
jgi:hypothetical protein